MLRVRRICTMVALAFAGMLVLYGVPDASAQKKMTYQQAYAKCKESVVRTFPDQSNTAGRYAHGGACMKQLGFNLKKSAKF